LLEFLKKLRISIANSGLEIEQILRFADFEVLSEIVIAQPKMRVLKSLFYALISPRALGLGFGLIFGLGLALGNSS